MFTISLDQKTRISAICNFANGKVNPIYEQVRIEANSVEGKVMFSACNGNQYSTFTLNAEVQEDARYCVSSKRLLIVTTALAGENAKFAIKDNDLFVTSGRSRLKLQTFSASDYPNMETFDAPKCRIETTIAQLANIVSQASYCVANADVRAYLCNMNWQISENMPVRICATDGHRLSMTHEQFPVSEGAGSYLMPTSVFQSVLALKLNGNDQCVITFSSNHACIEVPNYSIMTTLGEGVYPNVDRIIPNDNSKSITVNLAEMTDLARRLHAVAQLEKNPTIRMCFKTNGQCEMQVKSANGDDFTDEIDLVDSSLTEEVIVGVNSKYLLDAITQQSGENVTMRLNLVGAIKIISDNQNLITLVMPTRI
ncbi:DNA polymerase III subunit beta [Shewanella aestuarii]|uniref:Beta sliding clamp n=1 Tax=Shewanella aestuarii TaxID=1028752 RepID=A0A6G9QQB3_9GAMM|nr:DNA polymerase III subunit beta [Shewanella aestuarii]QIR16303.1 DNA polymerase III subunit beta [Shewanella aestuarii]